MKVSKVSLYKEFKVGLPNFSNMTARCGMEADLEPEDVDKHGTPLPDTWGYLWDAVNRQVSIEAGNLDPNWIKIGEFKNYFRVRIPKGGINEQDQGR